ncbi:MAG: hypothetical protein ACKOEC_01320 [Acidimicrobiia bacterium]
MATEKCERIGVLLVHGIGNQKPNEHLINEARNIVAALGEQVASITVSAEPAIAEETPKKFVPDYAKNMVRADVRTKSGEDKCFEFNEVYWAELGEPPTLMRQISFWFWALSMWTVAGREHSILPGLNSDMYVPKGDRFRPGYRFMLGFLGILFFLGAGTVGLINMIADRLKLPRIPISGLLANYIGDVMLYTQPLRVVDPTASEIGQPPRVQIRARMVDALIEFAGRNYDRWYVVAHSLGTVVAFNGLMETVAALPNYLTKERWAEVKASPLYEQLQKDVPDLMLPRRPTWLSKRDGISRKRLFSRLQGLLTYGSAIGKFHGIWPIMVPVNQDEFVFHKNFQWMNVYDWMDPVSGPLVGFTTEKYGPFDKSTGEESTAGSRLVNGDFSAARIQHNISYSAGPVWLQSHLQYLSYPSAAYVRPKPFLVLGLASWLIDKVFDPTKLDQMYKAQPSERWRKIVANVELAAIGLAVWLATAALMWKLLPRDPLLHLTHTGWIATGVGACISAIVVNRTLEASQRPLQKHMINPSLLAKLRSRMAQGDVPQKLRLLVLAVALFLGVAIGCLISWLPTAVVCLTKCLRGAADCGILTIPLDPTSFGSQLLDCLSAVHDTVRHWLKVRFSLGLLSVTALLIVVLGAIRWLFQPVPTRDEPAKATPPSAVSSLTPPPPQTSSTVSGT